MPRSTFTTLSLVELAQQAASRGESQGSDAAYLVSVGVIAAIVIGVFFGVGFSLLTQTREQIFGGSGPRDRGTEVKSLQSVGFPDLSSDAQSDPVAVELPSSAAVIPLPVLSPAQTPTARENLMPEARGSAFPGMEAAVSPATGALASAEALPVISAASQATRGPSATVPSPEAASGLPVATTPAMPSASPPLAAEVAELLARGDSFVLMGDVASARAFYERSSAGDGRAAVR